MEFVNNWRNVSFQFTRRMLDTKQTINTDFFVQFLVKIENVHKLRILVELQRNLKTNRNLWTISQQNPIIKLSTNFDHQITSWMLLFLERLVNHKQPNNKMCEFSWMDTPKNASSELSPRKQMTHFYGTTFPSQKIWVKIMLVFHAKNPPQNHIKIK